MTRGATTALLFAVSLPAHAVSSRDAEIAAAASRTPPGAVTVLVELTEPPVARYVGGIAGLSATSPSVTGVSLLAARREEVARYRDYLETRQDDLFERVRARVPKAEIGARYRTVFNGFAVHVPGEALPALANLPGVAAVHPVREYFPTLDASNVAMGAPAFWSALGGDSQAGAGMKIGIIDTGVDFSNPMFSDASLSTPAGFPKGDATLANGKVIVARFFQSLADSRDSDADLGHRTAQDLVGHGSHSAGVAAGSRVELSGSGRRPITVAGVAPKAWIGDYRVFSPRAFDDNIIAAIEAAVDDGMDVINMSFGSPPAGNPLDDPIIAAVENAVAAGVVATISAGNGGPDPSTVGFPGAAPGAITVAASTNAHYGLSDLGIFELISGGTSVPANLVSVVGGACGDQCSLPAVALSGPLADVDDVDGQLSGIACTSLPGGSLNGRIALVQRGTCTFVVKGQNVAAAGAVGMVIYNSDDPAVTNSGEQLFNPGMAQASVPALLLRRSDGLALKSFIAASTCASRGRSDEGRSRGHASVRWDRDARPVDVLFFPRPHAGPPDQAGPHDRGRRQLRTLPGRFAFRREPFPCAGPASRGEHDLQRERLRVRRRDVLFRAPHGGGGRARQAEAPRVEPGAREGGVDRDRRPPRRFRKDRPRASHVPRVRRDRPRGRRDGREPRPSHEHHLRKGDDRGRAVLAPANLHAQEPVERHRDVHGRGHGVRGRRGRPADRPTLLDHARAGPGRDSHAARHR